MSDKLQRKINRIQMRFTPERLRQLFTGRQNDSLFSDVGKLDLTSREAALGEHQLVWHGYHLLVDSPYLNK